MEKEWIQSPPPRFPLKITDIVKNKQLCGKPSAIGLSKYVRINNLSPLLFTGIIRLQYFLNYLIFSQQETRWAHMSKSQNQNLTYPVSSTQFLVNFLLKKISSKTLLFCGYRSQRIFNFDCFSWYHIYIFEKKKKN